MVLKQRLAMTVSTQKTGGSQCVGTITSAEQDTTESRICHCLFPSSGSKKSRSDGSMNC